MPSIVNPGAPKEGGSIIKALDAIKLMDSIDKSSAKKSATATATKDLPQDYVFSPAATEESPRDGNPQGSPDVAGNVHAWVSPNKSDEVASKENSPDVSSTSNKDSSPESFINLSKISAASDENKENEAPAFKSNGDDEDTSTIAILGKNVLKEQKPDVPALNLADVSTPMTELKIFDGSKKDWIKIVYGGREVMVLLHDDVTEFELSETLIASLGITDEIVGLKSTGTVLTEDGFSMFKGHGDVVIPFSALSSGRLQKVLQDFDCCPTFELVTANVDDFIEKYNAIVTDGSVSSAGTPQEDDSVAVDVRESMLYTDAFVELMNNSTEFDSIEKNSLLRFGVDNADSNVLFRAAFRVAVYTENMGMFVSGLKSIATILLGSQAESSEDTMLLMEEGVAKKSAKTIFALSEFVIATDELYECDDLTTEQYATLLHAIFSDDEDIERLFDLYQNPDFLVACETESLRCSLLLRDLLHIALRLTPIQAMDKDDTLLKWAIHTGVHNFAASIDGDLPKEFVNIMYHMFSSGDELVLAACQDFIATNDTEVMDEMIKREWSIYAKNNPRKKSNKIETVVEKDDEKRFNTSGYEEKLIPDVLSTAANCLAEMNDVTADEASAILKAYVEGNLSIYDIYETYMEDGDTDTFLSMLRVIAPTLAKKHEEEEDPKNLLAEAFRVFEHDETFRAVDLAALRLAAVRKDKHLVSSLTDFNNGDGDIQALKVNLLNVAADVIADFEE